MVGAKLLINDEKFMENLRYGGRDKPKLEDLASEWSGVSEKSSPEVADCFMNVTDAALLLSANGMFLKYAGPTIRNNYSLVKIAVSRNGDAIQYASHELLMNLDIAADLLLACIGYGIGHPCEAFRKVIHDENYIFDVCKKAASNDPSMVGWICDHMYNNYEEQLEKRALIREFLGQQKHETELGDMFSADYSGIDYFSSKIR